MADQEKLKIGDFVFDPSRNLLAGGEGEVVLEPKVVDVLAMLAAQPGTVLGRDALIDAVWKTEFGADERLTRTIYQLRKAFGDERGTPRYIETVSKRGYRLVATVAKLEEDARSRPPSAAVPEMSLPVSEAQSAPSVIASNAGAAIVAADNASTPTQPPWWMSRRAYAAAGVAALAVAVVAAWLWTKSGPVATAFAEDVIELRPLVVIGDDPALDNFARQTHATLKRMLASNQLRVVERNGVPSQARADSGSSEFTLSGTLEKTGDAYGVTLYLDSRADAQTLWSRRFARSAPYEAGLREDIGATTAHEIGCGLKQRAKAKRKPSNQAFMIYLEFCGPLGMDLGETALARAQHLVATAPDDAHGHAMVAYANAIMAAGRSDLAQQQMDIYAADARKAVARALELDPKNPKALEAEALLGSNAEYWRSLDESTVLSTSFRARGMRMSGRLREALHLTGRSLASEPLSTSHRFNGAMLLMQLGRHEAADRVLAELLQQRPDHPGALRFRFFIAAFYGDPERALALLKDDYFAVAYLACWRAFLEARRRPAERVRNVASVRAACEPHYRVSDDSNRAYIVRILAAVGDVDGAIERMRALSWTWRGSTIPLWYPEMAAVRRDTRFMPLIVPSQLPEYWLKSGNWPDFCRDDVLPYNCKAAAAQALKRGVVATSGEAGSAAP